MSTVNRLLFLLSALCLLTSCFPSTKRTGISSDVKTTLVIQADILAHLTEADHALATHPADVAMLVQRASSLALLERHGESAETFRQLSILSPTTQLDRTSLYLWTRSLYELKLYGRARIPCESLSANHPHSHVADRGRDILLKIEKLFSKSATTKNLNWYLDRGVQAYRDARPALAIDYLEECRLLSTQSQLPIPDPNLLYFSLGGAYLECGDEKQALLHLKGITPEYAQYRSGLMLALAMKSTDADDEAARDLLLQIKQHATRESVKARAQEMLIEWTSEGETTP